MYTHPDGLAAGAYGSAVDHSGECVEFKKGQRVGRLGKTSRICTWYRLPNRNEGRNSVSASSGHIHVSTLGGLSSPRMGDECSKFSR